MSAGNIFYRIDDLILERVFQPIVDRLPEGVKAFALGSSFLLGSVILQAAAALLPIIFVGSSFSDSMQNGLALLCSLVIYLGFQRFAPLVQPGKFNPLRPMLFSLRIVVLAYVIGSSLFLWFRPPPHAFLIWEELDILSQLVFVIGLYFMSCQPRPPSWQPRNSKRTAHLSVVPDHG